MSCLNFLYKNDILNALQWAKNMDKALTDKSFDWVSINGCGISQLASFEFDETPKVNIECQTVLLPPDLQNVGKISKRFLSDHFDEIKYPLEVPCDNGTITCESISYEAKRVEPKPDICELLKRMENNDGSAWKSMFELIDSSLCEDRSKPLNMTIVPFYEYKALLERLLNFYEEKETEINNERAARKAAQEEERKAKEEAERKAREEAERKAKEEEERKEAERQAALEAMRKAVEENKRRKQMEAEQKAREEAEREAQENILVKQIQGVAEKEIAELRSSFIHVKGGTFLSYLVRDKGIRTVGDFRISSMPLPKLLIDCIKSNGCKNWLSSDKDLFLERLGKLLGFKVMFPTIEQMEFAVRGGTELDPTHCCKSDRYLAKEENRLFATPSNMIEESGTLYLNNERYKTLGCSVVYPENHYCNVHICCLPDAFEAERKAAEEAERKAKEEAERKARKEEKEKLKAKMAAEQKAKEEAERKAKEEAERKAKEEAERKAKEEAERIAKEEAERKAKEEAERKAKEGAERKAKEEAERKAKEEAERKAKEEAERNSYKSIIEEFVSDTKDCEYKDGLIFGKKKSIKYVTAPITRHIWNAVVKKTTESDFNDDEYVAQKELGDFLKELNAHFDGRIVFEYLHKNIHANVHLQVYEKLDKKASFVYIKEDNR